MVMSESYRMWCERVRERSVYVRYRGGERERQRVRERLRVRETDSE
jgi:hypothetical protein